MGSFSSYVNRAGDSITFQNTARSDTGNAGYEALQNNGNHNVWRLNIYPYTDHTYSVTLDSVDYDIRLRWNTRDESWQMIIGIAGEDPTITFKCVNGLNLLEPYQYLEGVPDGQLYIIDTVIVKGRPAFETSTTATNEDTRFQLIYIDALEAQA